MDELKTEYEARITELRSSYDQRLLELQSQTTESRRQMELAERENEELARQCQQLQTRYQTTFSSEIFTFFIPVYRFSRRVIFNVDPQGTLGPYATKRVAAGAHLPTSWVFEPANPDDRADYRLHFISTRSRSSVNVNCSHRIRD